MPPKNTEAEKKAAQRAWRAKNKDRRLANNRNHYRGSTKRQTESRGARLTIIAHHRAIIAEAKNVPCKDCTGRFPTCVMDFDHVSGIKVKDVSSMITHSPTPELLAEIKKCEVVCANCHRVRTHNRRLQATEEAKAAIPADPQHIMFAEES